MDVVLLLVAAFVPMAYALSVVTPLGRTANLGTVATSSVAPAGTPNPNSMAWTSSVQQAAALAYVNSIISKMSLDEEIGQMLVTDFNGTELHPRPGGEDRAISRRRADSLWAQLLQRPEACAQWTRTCRPTPRFRS